MDEWGRVIKTEAEWRGMKFIVRDPANNPTAMQQALTALVDEKPDVIVVQNPSVTLLMKELKRAEAQGIHVVQMNMSSNYKSDAFVGADWYEVGRMLAEDVVKVCGTGSGTSGEVQIVQGELTAAASVDQIAGIVDVLNKDKAIKIVSNQAALWDANNALNITATVIQQHPNLCASIGFWGIMEFGCGSGHPQCRQDRQSESLCLGRRLSTRLRSGRARELLQVPELHGDRTGPRCFRCGRNALGRRQQARHQASRVLHAAGVAR